MTEPGVDRYWEAAGLVCTLKELQAIELRDRHGRSELAIALLLGISRRSVRDRLLNADRKIELAMRGREPNGTEAA